MPASYESKVTLHMLLNDENDEEREKRNRENVTVVADAPGA